MTGASARDALAGIAEALRAGRFPLCLRVLACDAAAWWTARTGKAAPDATADSPPAMPRPSSGPARKPTG